MITARFHHHERHTPELISHYFEPAKPITYTAGQFIELTLPHDSQDERGIKRWFTLSSSPTEPLLAITTRHSSVSSTYKDTLLSLKPDTEVQIAEPMGDFVLPIDKKRPLIWVTGGIGVTPIRSMIRYLLDCDERRKIELFYAARSTSDFVFEDLFELYALPVTYISTDSTAGSKQLTSEMIYEAAQAKADSLIYISGPEPMTERFVDELQDLGLKTDRLVTDYFPGYPEF